MIGKRNTSTQLNIFKVPLVQFISEEHELCVWANEINWQSIEDEFTDYYCLDKGRPSFPLRKVVGVLLLKSLFNNSHDSVVDRCQENPCWQYFCRDTFFQHEKPFDPTELIQSRKRIGEEGAEKLFKLSINLFGEKRLKKKRSESTPHCRKRASLARPMQNCARRLLYVVVPLQK